LGRLRILRRARSSRAAEPLQGRRAKLRTANALGCWGVG
jgi:hypothetical protein